MILPPLTEIANMTLEQLEQLAKDLNLGYGDETHQATANRLYIAGQDEEAFVYQNMSERRLALIEKEKSGDAGRRRRNLPSSTSAFNQGKQGKDSKDNPSMGTCEHFLKHFYRLEGKGVPQLHVRTQCDKCGLAGPWFNVKANRTEHEIKKRRSRDAFFEMLHVIKRQNGG